jgi:hypothetical protein
LQSTQKDAPSCSIRRPASLLLGDSST